MVQIPDAVRVEPSLLLRIARPEDAKELYSLVEKNRVYLREWLPWLDDAESIEDEIDFINTEDLEDAMGEITNIISGSFKSMLEGICHLGLPIVTRGTDYTVRFPGGTTKVDVGFECDDYCFHVSLIQADQE